jgi:hypothetical protein
MPGGDAEVTADVDDDCADGPAKDLGGDFLFCGQMGETRIVAGVRQSRLGDRRRDLACWASWARGGQADGLHREVSAAGGAGAKPGFQCHGAPQAAGDESEDDGQIGGSEGFGEAGETWSGGALLNRGGQFFPVVDQFANEAEDAADARGHVRTRPLRVGFRGTDGRFGTGEHERDKNTEERRL